jgi:hypothetical protein
MDTFIPYTPGTGEANAFLEELKKAHEVAVSAGAETFDFEFGGVNYPFYTGYSKYLIQHMENELST